MVFDMERPLDIGLKIVRTDDINHLGLFEICIEYRNSKGEKHREGDLPAKICQSKVEYYKNDKLHRGWNKPARIILTPYHRELSYYKNDELHRGGDKPALINIGRKKMTWMIDGKENRKNKKDFAHIEKIDRNRKENPIYYLYRYDDGEFVDFNGISLNDIVDETPDNIEKAIEEYETYMEKARKYIKEYSF